MAVLLHVLVHMPDCHLPVCVVAGVMPVPVTAMHGPRMVLAVAFRMDMLLGLALAGVNGCHAVPVSGCRPGSGNGAGFGGRRSIGLLRGVHLFGGIGLLRGIRLVLHGFAGIGGLDLNIGLDGSGCGLFGCKPATSGESHRQQTHKSDN